jgi:membrane associated rhomboid family serine protease
VYNLLRTFADFPTAASGAFTDMQFVPLWMCMRLFPDWVGTHEELGVILAIFVTLLVPSYLISRLLKTWVIDWYDLLASEGKSKSVMLGANRASYALLAVTGCVLLIKAYGR